MAHIILKSYFLYSRKDICLILGCAHIVLVASLVLSGNKGTFFLLSYFFSHFFLIFINKFLYLFPSLSIYLSIYPTIYLTICIYLFFPVIFNCFTFSLFLISSFYIFCSTFIILFLLVFASYLYSSLCV